MNEEPILKVYAIQNNEGLWYHESYFRGDKTFWSENINDAKIYQRRKDARTEITWASKFDKTGDVHNLVELQITAFSVLSEDTRVKIVNKKEKIRRLQDSIKSLNLLESIYGKNEEEHKKLNNQIECLKKEIKELKEQNKNSEEYCED